MKKNTSHLNTIAVLLINEVRLRSRRLSSLFALLLMVAISWNMIADPKTGMTLIAVNGARVLYTSSAMALGSASQMAVLIALIGFYLLRGRMSEDIRTGIGSIIATTSIPNSLFLISRWLGGAVYLLGLISAFMITMLTLHVIRGEAPIEMSVYLQTYFLLMVPAAFGVTSMAILFDSIPFLMGKLGDVAYFFIWAFQLSMMAIVTQAAIVGIHWTILDLSGLSVSLMIFKMHLLVDDIAIGFSGFDAAKAPIILDSYLWTYQLACLRLASSVLAMLPMLLAIPLFHRYSPDKVKANMARKRRSPMAMINQWSRPLAKQAHPLFAIAGKMPNVVGRIIAELGLTFVSAPFMMIVLIILVSLQALMSIEVLKGLAFISIVIWGIFISDISTRDYQSGIESMTSVINGGSTQGFLRHYGVSCLLGLLFVGVIILRWSYTQPILAIAMLVGIFSLSAIASFLGRCSRTPRTFLSLFLMWAYIATQTPTINYLDVVGFNGSANVASMTYQAIIAIVGVLLGYGYTQFKSRHHFS